jgi:hypothetical protein
MRRRNNSPRSNRGTSRVAAGRKVRKVLQRFLDETVDLMGGQFIGEASVYTAREAVRPSTFIKFVRSHLGRQYAEAFAEVEETHGLYNLVKKRRGLDDLSNLVTAYLLDQGMRTDPYGLSQFLTTFSDRGGFYVEVEPTDGTQSIEYDEWTELLEKRLGRMMYACLELVEETSNVQYLLFSGGRNADDFVNAMVNAYGELYAK